MYTGVAIIIKKDTEKVVNFAVETKVKVASMSMEEIAAYIRTGEHKDKAGAYAIQGKFAPYIASPIRRAAYTLRRQMATVA